MEQLESDNLRVSAFSACPAAFCLSHVLHELHGPLLFFKPHSPILYVAPPPSLTLHLFSHSVL